MKLAPGEGERRAQRGYVPQYDLGAQVIYEALASGRLLWVGVADRGAGSFDDVVLGLRDSIVAYQVKTSRDPENFSIHTLLLGADSLLTRMVEARRQIAATDPESIIETVYICDDYPRTNDKVSDFNLGLTSASFLRAHEAHHRSWTIQDWRNSQYASFIASVQERTGLDDAAFEVMWRNTQFRISGLGRVAGVDDPTAGDRKRIAEIAALLPRLVADSADKDRWPVAELLERLGWSGPFNLRHGHTFPVDALYQSNTITQEQLAAAMKSVASGYVSVVGPPGSGKSTLLAAGLLPTPRAHIVRYLAFVPGKGQGLGRGEAFDFLHDLVTQLKQQHLGKSIIPGAELPELRSQLELLLQEASLRFHREDTKTIVVIDGLDHVFREEKPQYSLLRELPLPGAVPEGVLLVLGTQRLDLPEIPAAVVDQAQEVGRLVKVAPLSRSAVNRLVEMSNLPADVDHNKIFARSEGHPLSTRYIIDGLVKLRNPEAREEWLANGPMYEGDIDVFYRGAWHDLKNNAQAQRGMAYLALAEGPINPATLDILIGPEATDALWRAAGHLLRRNRNGDWSVFHNSLRIFLRFHTSLRHGLPDTKLVGNRYRELAAVAGKAINVDGQQWMELRYLARAAEHERVAMLASPSRFREQFIEGRDPEEIRADISLSFYTAKVLKKPQLVFDLILSSHELSMRTEALGDDLFSTLVYLGKHGKALAVLNAGKGVLTVGKGFELVEAFLANGELEEARELFEALEPIDVLLGSEQIEVRRVNRAGLEGWAELALAFREPGQLLASLKRLRVPDHEKEEKAHLQNYLIELKLLAARGQLRRNPDLSLVDLIESLQIDSKHEAFIFYIGIKMSFQAERDATAIERLKVCSNRVHDLYAGHRRELADIASTLGRADLCLLYIDGVEPPTLKPGRFDYSDDSLRSASKEVILHASLRSRLGLSSVAGEQSDSRLLTLYQEKLESLGRLHGAFLIRQGSESEFLRDAEAVLEFLQRGEGEGSFDFERGRIDRVMDEAITAMVDTAAVAGGTALQEFSQRMDARLSASPRGLGLSSVRRAYAEAMFRHDGSSSLAKQRIAYQPGTDSTPAGHFSEAALTARSLAQVGLERDAETVLQQMHNDGLGFSRPAKKDPQYLFWEDIFVRANREDPAGRSKRVRFFGRLLGGLAKTEGEGAAYRVMGTLLQEAAKTDPSLAAAVFDLAEEHSLSTWSDTIWSLCLGVAQEHPLLCLECAAIIGRLGIPFDSDFRKESLLELIRCAPSDLLDAIVQKVLGFLETDAPAECRILAIESLVKAAEARGLKAGAKELARWQNELPAPKSGNSPEDPFFLLRSLDAIASLLNEKRGTTDSYGARSAFSKVAPHSEYERVKRLFEDEEELNTDERVIEVMARIAIKAGRQEDAKKLLPRLERLARDRGSWGNGWSGKSKQLYFWLRCELKDCDAAANAFDEFVEDLSAGRESCDYILPELGPLFALISPTLTWEDAWDRLAAHLCEFREFKRGSEIGFRQDIPVGPEHVLADLIFRSIETTSIPLNQMARTVAVELSLRDIGAPVVSALLQRLSHHGNELAIEAAQIAWECRFVPGLRSYLESICPSMLDSVDVAVSQTAVSIANYLNFPTSTKHRDLPTIYTIVLPNDSGLNKFDTPSGMSRTSAGLYTDDVLSWTWALEIPLRIARYASGLGIPNLRYRAAQLMTELGGRSFFGPEAVKRQMGKLRSLSLHTSYRKLTNWAAFYAMRLVAGELVAAATIHAKLVPLLSISSGGYSRIVRTAPPATRPVGIPAPHIPDAFESRDIRWVEGVAEDLTRPYVEGFCVVAAVSIHERSFREESWLIEQYFGPSSTAQGETLFEFLQSLPQVTVTDRLEYHASPPTPGGILHPEPIMAGSIDLNMLMVCPTVAAAIGWHPDADDVFTLRDVAGDVVASTLCWRDGGVSSREDDRAIHRHGYAVLIKKNQLQHLLPHLSKEYELRNWRRILKSATDEHQVQSVRREELPPVLSKCD
jgi:hypothetical protein